MSDITLSILQSKLPADTLTEGTDDVSISLKKLLGKNVSLTSPVVTQLMARLFDACQAAQEQYNSTNAAGQPDFGSFGNKFVSPPRTVEGQLVIPVSLSFNYVIPVALNEAKPVIV